MVNMLLSLSNINLKHSCDPQIACSLGVNNTTNFLLLAQHCQPGIKKVVFNLSTGACRANNDRMTLVAAPSLIICLYLSCEVVCQASEWYVKILSNLEIL